MYGTPLHGIVALLMSEISPAEHQPYRLPPLDTEHLMDRLAECPQDRPSYIHIGGVSASGKSTISRLLTNVLPDSRVLPVDSYLAEGLSSKVFNHTPPDPSRPYIGGIDPEIWDLDQMESHLRELAENRAVQLPVFDETVKDRVGYEHFEPTRFIILEGGHSFSERFRGFAAYKILVDAPFHDRIVRKITRTHLLYNRTDIDEVLDRYCTKDEPVRQAYLAEHEAIADQVVQNPSNPSHDFQQYQSTALPESTGTLYRLMPKSGYGQLYPTEQLGAVVDHDGAHSLRYDVDGKRLIDLSIPEHTLSLMSLYYEITR